MLSCLPSFMVSQTRFVEERRASCLHPIDELQRFRLLIVALCCSICISMIYVFDLFTKDFRERFQLSAGDMSIISTVGMCTCWFVFPYGFVFNYFGPTPLIMFGLTTGLTGALCLGLVFKGFIAGNLATITVLYALLCSASGLLDSATIVTLAETFPRNRGPVIGVAKVMTGLGSSMWASLSLSAFDSNAAAFLFFIAALMSVVATLAIFFIRLPPYFMTPWRRRRMEPAKAEQLELLRPLYHTKNVPMRRLGVAFLTVTALLLFFTVATPMKAYTQVSRGAHIALATITVALFLCFFLMGLPIAWLGGVNEPVPDEAYLSPLRGPQPPQRQNVEESESSVDDGDGDADNKRAKVVVASDAEAVAVTDSHRGDAEPVSATPLPAVDDGSRAAGSAAAEAKQAAAAAMERTRQDPRYGGSLKENLLKPDVWLLILGFTFQSVIGNIIMFNGSTVSVAINGNPRSKELSALFTAFLGVGSGVGRISLGLFEAYVQHQPLHKRRFLVTMALPFPAAVAVVGCVLLLVLPGQSILAAYILVYFEEGFFNAIRAIIYPSLFEGNHPVYYNMSFLSSIISIVCFNYLLFGRTVDKQHDRLGYAAGEDCKQMACVRTPILVALATATLAVVMQTIVHVRYSRFVHNVRAQRRSREQEEEEARERESCCLEPVFPRDAGEAQRLPVRHAPG